MRTKILLSGFSILILLGISVTAVAMVVSGQDSTQPRGSKEGISNSAKQDLSPVVQGFAASATNAVETKGDYENWAGMMMANAMRDPAFFATLSVANRDMINLLNNFHGSPGNMEKLLTGQPRGFTTFNQLLIFLKLDGAGIKLSGGRLRPEDILPFTADLCLRCHTPAGWMEGRSEPKTVHSPFLKGQFWGAEFLENSAYSTGDAKKADLSTESEAEMDGLQCDFCHRAKDNFKRKSNHDGSEMTNGNGGFFVDRNNPFSDKVGKNKISTVYDFLKTGEFCGTCHDVTNPLLRTKTIVNGKVPEDMPHPIERTYTEWYWSDYRKEKRCQDCHVPMKFQGAQTWMISPVLNELWGKVDQKWREYPYFYQVPDREPLWTQAMERNRDFMQKEAAEMSVGDSSFKGNELTVNIKIINKTGHKLPTGFAEGRQMWLHVKAEDEAGKPIFESGYLKDGYLVRDEYFNGTYKNDPDKKMIKVYEVEALAADYDPAVIAPGNEHFHFILMNKIIKDNRIPPKGFNKKAYTADGAFIIPHGPKDTDYAEGQNWDITPYTFTVPEGVKGKIRITATLNYQTFNREYLEFLNKNDREPTKKHGGNARNLPAGPYENYKTWGAAMYDLWKNKAKMGPAVIMQKVSGEISPKKMAYPGLLISLLIVVFLMAAILVALRYYRKNIKPRIR